MNLESSDQKSDALSNYATRPARYNWWLSVTTRLGVFTQHRLHMYNKALLFYPSLAVTHHTTNTILSIYMYMCWYVHLLHLPIRGILMFFLCSLPIPHSLRGRLLSLETSLTRFHWTVSGHLGGIWVHWHPSQLWEVSAPKKVIFDNEVYTYTGKCTLYRFFLTFFERPELHKEEDL